MSADAIKIPYREILESTLDCFWIVDAQTGTILHTNESYCVLSGYSKKEIVGKTIKDFEVSENSETVMQSISLMRMLGKMSFIANHRKKDGRIAKLETNVTYKEMDGKQYIFALMRDSTEKLEIQEKFLSINRELREMVKTETQKRLSKDMAFSTVFEIFGTGVVITDGDGKILDVNRGFCKIFDIATKGAIINKKVCSLLNGLPDEEADLKFKTIILKTNALTKDCERKMDCHSCSPRQYEEEFHMTNKKVNAIINLSCYKNKQNDVNFVFSITDITAERELERRQKQSEKLLISQSRMAAMGEMIGAIAHQWRQPLNLLGILVQDLGFSYANNELTTEYVNSIIDDSMKQIAFMSNTIDDFRRFFRTDKEKANFSLASKIDESLSMVSGMLKANGIELTTQILKRPTVAGYANELSQVALNLISNAKDAFENAPKSLEKLIKVTVTSDEHYGIAEISDNAGGIDKNIISRIFDPYFTTKEEGKGTGIGLYMSKTIVETNMGGVLEVSNKEGGAAFTIKIPLTGETKETNY